MILYNNIKYVILCIYINIYTYMHRYMDMHIHMHNTQIHMHTCIHFSIGIGKRRKATKLYPLVYWGYS